jgi:hypothetical protein
MILYRPSLAYGRHLLFYVCTFFYVYIAIGDPYWLDHIFRQLCISYPDFVSLPALPVVEKNIIVGDVFILNKAFFGPNKVIDN